MFKKLKLGNKLMLGFLLPVICFIFIAGYFSYAVSEKKLEDQVLASLNLIVKTKKDYVEAFQYFNKGRVADWSSDGYIRDIFEKIIVNKDGAMVEELMRYIKSRKHILDPEIVITDIVGIDGIIVVSTIPERIGFKETIDDLDKEYNFTKAKNASFGEAFVSSVVVEDEPGHSKDSPMWHMSVPLVSLKSNEVIGVMVNHVSNDGLKSLFEENQQTSIIGGTPERYLSETEQKTFEIYLVDIQKLMLTPSLFVENAVLNQIVDTEPVRKCYETGEGMSGIYNDYRGVSVFGASACVNGDSNWTLLAEIDESEVAAQLNSVKIIVVNVSILVLLGAMLMIYFLYKRIIYPIRELSGSIKKMTEGKLFQKLKTSSLDEVGDLVESFNEMSEKIEEEDRAKSEFVSLASHQLLTPLTSIKWYVEVMLSGTMNGISDKQKEYLEVMSRVNQNMIDLVRALLDVSRIELGVFSVEPEIVNIVDVVEDVLVEVDPTVKEKNLNIVKDFGQKAPIMNADPKLLRIICQNILTNAIKYTPENGKIVIGIKQEDLKFVIKVSDTGYGIPKELQSKVFSKFFRAYNIKDKESEGTGLGLYIVRSIIDHSGGKIWFESEENKGTTFYVEFPAEGMKKKEGEKKLGM